MMCLFGSILIVLSYKMVYLSQINITIEYMSNYNNEKLRIMVSYMYKIRSETNNSCNT